MIKLIIFAMMYLLINGIITTKLLKNKSWLCNQPISELKSVIETKHDCLDLGGDWHEALFNYDNIIRSI